MPTFDELKQLALHDPDAFEQLRKELVGDCISGSNQKYQRRLRGRQFVIDARRRIASTPTKALLDIQAMMYDSITNLQQALLDHQFQSDSAVSTGARVLPFRRPNKNNRPEIK